MGEQESDSPEQLNEFLFMQIVMMFQGAAFQHMGKVVNPVTQKVDRDLAQAKNAIDILGMLKAKTQGNLNENENRLLDHTLYELRMNYVDEVNKGETPESEDSEAAGPDVGAPESEDSEAAGPDVGAPESEDSEAAGPDVGAPESEDSEAAEAGESS